MRNNIKDTLLNKISFRNEKSIKMNCYVVTSQFMFLMILLQKKKFFI